MFLLYSLFTANTLKDTDLQKIVEFLIFEKSIETKWWKKIIICKLNEQFDERLENVISHQILQLKVWLLW